MRRVARATSFRWEMRSFKEKCTKKNYTTLPSNRCAACRVAARASVAVHQTGSVLSVGMLSERRYSVAQAQRGNLKRASLVTWPDLNDVRMRRQTHVSVSLNLLFGFCMCRVSVLFLFIYRQEETTVQAHWNALCGVRRTSYGTLHTLWYNSYTVQKVQTVSFIHSFIHAYQTIRVHKKTTKNRSYTKCTV